MTRGYVIKKLPIKVFIHWLISIERSAIKNADKINKMSDKDLEVDWYEFLMKEDNDANNP